jgi:hypothetical protein
MVFVKYPVALRIKRGIHSCNEFFYPGTLGFKPLGGKHSLNSTYVVPCYRIKQLVVERSDVLFGFIVDLVIVQCLFRLTCAAKAEQ